MRQELISSPLIREENEDEQVSDIPKVTQVNRYRAVTRGSEEII